ncbi:hypothetical protein FRX31_026619 [Thalictrum thalictroides]|uniref:Uncharacterized protein n=1 Tax=Thalictrum thalictroides TaxID=46969 RepID=A0A7J6VFX2_THATH|nr:hypothetical protein FRX31_026619 [Thalictrum thalictroides]
MILQTEFKFNIPVTLAHIHLEMGFPAKWKVIKSRIRTKYLKDAESIEETIKRCPDGFDRGNWELFVIRENNPKVIDKASPEKQHGRVDVWLKSHERPDGTVPESIREKYEQVKLAHERIMSSTSNEEGIDNYIDLNSDALAEALLHNADSSTSKLEAQMEVVQSDIKNMSKAFMALMHQVSSNAVFGVQPPPSTNTPQAEVGSNSAHRPS